MKSILVGITFLALVVLFMSFESSDQVLRRKAIVVNHDTYAPGEDNYDFCTQLCTSKGGVNCGGQRKGCCTASGCQRNKIYGWNECATGQSVQLGTTKCIGTWGS